MAPSEEERENAEPSGGASGGSAGPRAPLALGPIESQVLNEAFKAVAAGGGLGDALQNTIGNLPNLANIFASTALGRQTMKLFDGWEIDETTSAPEIMLQQQAKSLAMKAQGQLLKGAQSMVLGGSGLGSLDVGAAIDGAKDQVAQFFGGVSSSASLGAAHLGMPDDMGNTLAAVSAPTVLVEGKVLGVVGGTDKVMPAGKPVVAGAGTVLAMKGTLPVARATSATAAPSVLRGGAATVLVGGAPVVVPPGPPVDPVDPKVVLGLSMMLYTDGKDEAVSADPANRPGESGIEPDPGSDKPRLGLKDVGKPLPGMEDWKLAELMDADQTADGESYPAGYRAGLFVNEKTGETVLIHQGTNLDTATDFLKANIPQGTGFVPPQYQQALEDAQRFKAQYPNLTVGGHSLGGGLATYAGLGIGANVVTFNPAGLGTGALASLDALGVQSIRPGQVSNYVTSNDILTGVSTWFGQPAPVGDIYEFPMTGAPGLLDGIPLLSFLKSAKNNHQTSVIWDEWMDFESEGNKPELTGTLPLPVLTSWSPYGQ